MLDTPTTLPNYTFKFSPTNTTFYFTFRVQRNDRATNHGRFGEFQDTEETWQSYVKRLLQHFIATDVKSQEKQRALLLSTVGAQTYQLIRNLLIL